jgi:hypothetical protein
MYKPCIFYALGGLLMKQFVITKKIAKHGSQNIIVIPRMLQDDLKPKTIVKITIDILKEPEVLQND